MNTATEAMVNAPDGSSRVAVRGFAASMPRVDQAVEGHRERAGAGHRDRDPDKRMPRRNSADGQKGTDVGEREREECVFDLDQAGKQGSASHQRSGADVVGCRTRVGEQAQRMR